MQTPDPAANAQPPSHLRWPHGLGLGFLYWLAFLLVLEPDNLLRAWNAGTTLPFDVELERIGGAAMLGALATPTMLRLSHRYPIVGFRARRNVAIHIGANIGMAVLLIVASCVLAAWAFEDRLLPTAADIRTQLASNATLLVFALSAFTAIAHLVRSRVLAADRYVAKSAPAVSTRIPVKNAGKLRFVDIGDVDWIEAQGNYVALHVGAHAQLIRRTLTDLESELDPGRFVRIHRSMIVTLARIREMKTLANGDASLALADGNELRVSRRYREAVRERWTALATRAPSPLADPAQPA